MLLAEALRERADAQRQLAALRDRITGAARYTEGEEPAEDAAALLEEAEAVIDRLAELILLINRSNLDAVLADSRALTAALAERDALRTRFGLLKGAADAAAGGRDASRFGRAGTPDVCFPGRFWPGRKGISARDALHVAVMKANQIERIVSFDDGFDRVPGIERLS